MTGDIHFFQRELLRAINDLSSGSEMMPPPEIPGSAQQRLFQLVQIKDARQAVLQLRSLRYYQKWYNIRKFNATRILFFMSSV